MAQTSQCPICGEEVAMSQLISGTHRCGPYQMADDALVPPKRWPDHTSGSPVTGPLQSPPASMPWPERYPSEDWLDRRTTMPTASMPSRYRWCASEIPNRRASDKRIPWLRIIGFALAMVLLEWVRR